MSDTDDIDDDVRTAIEKIDDTVPDEEKGIEQQADGTVTFVIESTTDEQDVDQIDDALEAAGYERDGIMEGPEKTIQFARPIEDEEDGGDD